MMGESPGNAGPQLNDGSCVWMRGVFGSRQQEEEASALFTVKWTSQGEEADAEAT
jgi:hypothetical protein